MTHDEERRANERRRLQAIAIIVEREKHKRLKHADELLLAQDKRRRNGTAEMGERKRRS